MNDHDALLRAIGEHPEEDTPRLMYADWLEENGEPANGWNGDSPRSRCTELDHSP